MNSISNILAIPLKLTERIPLSNAVKEYISLNYDEHPDLFSNDYQALDHLRTNITSLEVHVNSLDRLLKYHAQLVFLSSKLPIDIGIEFPWYPAFSKSTGAAVRHCNIQFERSCVIFNIAAMYSQLGVDENRSTAQGLKNAGYYFQCAAGCFQYLIDVGLIEMRISPPSDMTMSVLKTLKNLMLAQAQECFWQKGAMDGMKDSVIAKLANKVAEFYQIAVDGMQITSTTSMSSNLFSNEWIMHVRTKYFHFFAAAQFRKSREVLNQNKYGEEIGRLKAAMVSVNKGMEFQRYLRPSVLNDLRSLQEAISTSLNRAEKDNDLIYLNNVPASSALAPIGSVEMVKPLVPMEISQSMQMLTGEGSKFGPPLFSRLVSFSIHQAANIYQDRKTLLVNEEIIARLEELNQMVYNTLQSLNLPGTLQAIEQPIGLPPSLLRRAEDVRATGGMDHLRVLFEDVSRQREHVERILEDGFEILDQEAGEDEDFRDKYSDETWVASLSPSHIANINLVTQGNKHQDIFLNARKSDEVVVEKMDSWEPFIEVLAAGHDTLMQVVPASQGMVNDAKGKSDAQRVRNIIDELEDVIRKRKAKQEFLRRISKEDDIRNEILKEATRLSKENPGINIETAHFEDFFSTHLKKYTVYKEDSTKESQTTKDLLERLVEANQVFIASRKSNNQISQREKALQNLDTAALKFVEIKTNMEEGLKFYNDFAKVLNSWVQECKEYSLTRQAEKQSQLSGASHTRTMSGSESQEKIDSNLIDEMDQLHITNEDALASAPSLDGLDNRSSKPSCDSNDISNRKGRRVEPGEWRKGSIAFAK